MSYDYNALVQNFWKARAAAKEQKNADASWMEAVQVAETLSQECPMTPLLWMQYADAAYHGVSPTLALPILELGLLEFPGSVILHLRAVSVAMASENDDKDAPSVDAILERAIAAVRRGSHRNQDGHVLRLFQHWLARCSSSAKDVFTTRSRVPMKHGNETLHDEVLQYLKRQEATNDDTTTHEILAAIDEGCRWEARVLGSLSQHDDAIDAAMDQQGILDPWAAAAATSEETSLPPLDWDTMLETTTQHMGLGGYAVARAFLQHAKEAQNLRVAPSDDCSTHQLAFAIYERGVAVCPTVESLWVNYIVDLTRSPEGLDRLSSVTARAVRNCPYSLALAQHQLYATEKLAMHQRVVVDPDELMRVANACLERNFLPRATAPLALYLSVTKVIKRRVLYLIAQETTQTTDKKKNKKSKQKDLAYDDAEPLPRKESSSTAAAMPLSETARAEIEDLIADLRDLYDDVEQMLPSTLSKAEWRKDRAISEALLLIPLSAQDDEDAAPIPSEENPLLKGLEMAVKAHSPPHPSVNLTYIQHYAVLCPVQKNPKHALQHIRRVRFLYRSAVEKASIKNSVHDGGDNNNMKLQFVEALKLLRNAWLEWEQTFGSERSAFRAKDTSDRKLERLMATLVDTKGFIDPTAGQAHPLPETNSEAENPPKRQRTDDGKEESTKTTQNASDVEHATTHPYTIRVSNLNPQSQDMDLVDVLRPKCGPIVHARIVRHKDSGKSKGWGLVQFEEKTSVDKALALGGVFGLHEKLITIERSQLPAVSLVPPGQHRVNPRGAGKASKRNEKRRLRNHQPAAEESAKPEDTTNTTLAFQPRSLARQRKPAA